MLETPENHLAAFLAGVEQSPEAPGTLVVIWMPPGRLTVTCSRTTIQM